MPRPRPILLLILDGWGHRVETEHNAIAQANCPNWRRLLAECPHTLVDTHGEHVGLPEGQMGNSEVGHMNIGSGRIVYQDLTRIDAALADGSFFDNAALVNACEAAKASGGTLHLLGLLSPGGVHSHERHLHAMLDLAARRGVPVTVHVAIGTDVVHMHPSADGAAIGEGSLRDFRRLTSLMADLGGGGVLGWVCRQESASMSSTWQCWTNLSTRAATQAAPEKTVPHCLKGRLVETTVERFSWRWLMML